MKLLFVTCVFVTIGFVAPSVDQIVWLTTNKPSKGEELAVTCTSVIDNRGIGNTRLTMWTKGSKVAYGKIKIGANWSDPTPTNINGDGIEYSSEYITDKKHLSVTAKIANVACDTNVAFICRYHWHRPDAPAGWTNRQEYDQKVTPTIQGC